MVWESSISLLETDLRNSDSKKVFFWVAKRTFDVCMSLALLPLLALFFLLLLILNPFFNSGPLLFIQIRMGRDCRAFKVYKFRSMREAHLSRRNADDPLETDRITKLGGFIRKTRIDELPQILNVLLGDMSLIGPRPDSFSHARVFLREISEYRNRHQVRPGISGLAQVDLGYAVGIEATRLKTRADMHYINNTGFSMETRLVFRTIFTILTKAGS